MNAVGRSNDLWSGQASDEQVRKAVIRPQPLNMSVDELPFNNCVLAIRTQENDGGIECLLVLVVRIGHRILREYVIGSDRHR